MSRTHHHRTQPRKSWFDWYVDRSTQKKRESYIPDPDAEMSVGGEDEWAACELAWFGGIL